MQVFSGKWKQIRTLDLEHWQSRAFQCLCSWRTEEDGQKSPQRFQPIRSFFFWREKRESVNGVLSPDMPAPDVTENSCTQ